MTGSDSNDAAKAGASGHGFGDTDDQHAVRCERAAAELRFGRPVRLHGLDESLAMLALDTATPASYDRFAHAAGQRHALFLTPPRAAMLGLQAPEGALVPLSGHGFEDACRIGYGTPPVAVPSWQAATPLAAAGARIARLAQLLPALVCIGIGRDDTAFRGCLDLHTADLQHGAHVAGRTFAIVARTTVPLRDVGNAEFVVFRGGLAQRDQIAIIVGQPDLSAPAVPVRLHSSCITGDLFGSLKCDCGDQLRRALISLHAKGGGVLLYLDQEGRGTGIAAKMRAYGLQNTGLDTVDADAMIGFGPDERQYDAAIAMLKGLGVASIDLLTNNPAKQAFLSVAGIEVVRRTPVLGIVTPENRDYLRTKATRSGHVIDLDSLIKAAT